MKKITILLLTVLAVFISGKTFAQGVLAPSGVSTSGNIIYAGGGLVTENGEAGSLMSWAGVGLGNINKLAVQVSCGSYDIGINTINIKLSEYFDNGNFVGFGVENLFYFGNGINYYSLKPSYYIAYTKDFKYVESAGGILPKCYMSIGSGVGRFSEIPELRIESTQNTKGTYVFGAAAYRINQSFTCKLDWDGTNMNAGLDFHAYVSKAFVFAGVAACDITSYSGYGVYWIISGGIAYQFRKPKKSPVDDIQNDNLRQAPNIDYY